jgi:hypothetical protein
VVIVLVFRSSLVAVADGKAQHMSTGHVGAQPWVHCATIVKLEASGQNTLRFGLRGMGGGGGGGGGGGTSMLGYVYDLVKTRGCHWNKHMNIIVSTF